MTRILIVAFALAVSAAPLGAQDSPWQAGLAKTVITPPEFMWMSGYASRTKPAEGKINDLWAKACVLKSPAGEVGALITLDLVGIDRGLSSDIRNRLAARQGWKVEQIILNCSHTHSGPVVGSNLRSMYILDARQQKLVSDYTRSLVDRIEELAEAARRDLRPAVLSWTAGTCGFAVNRRNNKEKEIDEVRKAGMLKGPVDHDVPVLAIHAPSTGVSRGMLRGVVFGYACHATVLSGYEWCGDYPGFAMDRLEADHKGAVALFWAGCGGDQNPLPRRSVALAKKYGGELADAVNRALGAAMTPIRGKGLAMAYREARLELDQVPMREQLAKDALSGDKYVAARAQMWLERLSKGEKLPEDYPYPIQAWRVGEDLFWVTLGGEVVVDYALRLKKELGGKTWIMAYANDVMAYIPSLRVLKEGGYEGGGAMVYYGLPGLWSANVEETIVENVRQLAKQTKR